MKKLLITLSALAILCLPVNAFAAIAIDAATSAAVVAGVGTNTYTHTVGSGANRIIFTGIWTGSDVSGDLLTNATSVVISGTGLATSSMTQIGKVSGATTTDRWVYLYYYINPPSGTNYITIIPGGSNSIGSETASYSGALQSGVPDASTSTTPQGASATTTVTTVADNTWSVLYAKGNGISTSTGSTERALEAGNRSIIVDSNVAKTPPGTVSLSVKHTGGAPNDHFGIIMASFAPAASAPATSNRKIRGVGISR